MNPSNTADKSHLFWILNFDYIIVVLKECLIDANEGWEHFEIN